jgi:hypothetical protein
MLRVFQDAVIADTSPDDVSFPWLDLGSKVK